MTPQFTISIFFISSSNNTLIIKFEKIFRHKNWQSEFGFIQEIIERGTFRTQEYEEIVFDFSSCVWVDPLPLVSLIVTLNYTKSNVTFLFPSAKLAESSKTLNVWAYFVTHGFSSALSILPNVSFKIIDKDPEINSDYENLDTISHKSFEKIFLHFATEQYYSNSLILPLHISDLSKVGDLEEFSHSIIKEIKNGISLKIPRFDLEQVLHKIEVALHEIILNVHDHAYPNEDKKMIGIYIRYRDGLLRTTLTKENKDNIQRSIGRNNLDGAFEGTFGMGGEFENCRELSSHTYIPNKIGFFEIILSDIGIGMSKTLEEHLNQYSFRELIRDVLNRGDLRNKKYSTSSKTRAGGLKLVADLWKKDSNNHFLALYEGKEVIGEKLPFITQTGVYKDTHDTKTPIKGLNFLLRFTIDDEFTTESRKNWSDNIVIPDYIQDILIKKQTENLSKEKFGEINKIPVDDFRFKEEKHYLKGNKNKQNLLILSSPKISKNEVWNYYFGSNSYINNSTSNELTIFIADIPPFQHFIYESALIESPTFASWARKVKQIVFVDKNLRFCFLSREIHFENTFIYKVNLEKTTNYLTNSNILSKIGIFDPSNDMSDFLQLLKFHDSRRFWDNVKSKVAIENGVSKDTSYVAGFYKGKIEWDKEHDLEYYLDFNTILNDTFNNQLFKILMERAPFFTFKNNYEIRSLDILTKPLVQISQSSFSTDDTLFTSYNNRETNDNTSILLLGSIFVSGVAWFDLMEHLKKENVSAQSMYFFVHKNAYSSDLPMSLLFWARDEIIDELAENRPVEGYKRVGKSPIIAENGYKFYKIPRYDEQGKPVYFRSPKDTYNDWQSSIDSIIKIGNYEYGNNVDLIKIDLLREISISFQRPEEKDLVQYLINHFYYSIFKNNDGLNNNSELSELKKGVNEFLKDPSNKIFFNDVTFIVYPTHLNTNYTISKVTDVLELILTPEAFNTFQKKLIALPTIRKGKGSSPYLFSPLSIEHIKDEIRDLRKNSEGCKTNVILFDCSVISGVTRKEIKHLLLTLGADDVRSFSIIDRNCLSITSPNRDRRRSYWRLDIPRLSSTENNPITDSIRKLDTEKDFYFPYVQDRIRDWDKYWGPKQYYYSDLESGLPEAQSIKINFTLPEGQLLDSEEVNYINQVRFSVNGKSQIGGKDNRLVIKNSNGLSIYLAEIMAMTGREDLIFADYLNKDENHNINEYAWIEIICTQLLLFRSDSPRQSQYKLIEELFKLCTQLNDTQINNYSSLAAITLLGQSKSNIQKLWDNVITNYNIDDVKKFNTDVHLFLAYSLTHKIKISKKNDITKFFTRYRINNKNDFAKKYEKLIYEFIEGQDDTSPKHEKRISNFDNTKLDILYLQSLIKELIIFESIIQDIPIENLSNQDYYTQETIDKIVEQLKLSTIEAKTLVSKYKNGLETHNEDKKELTNLMVELKTMLKDYISSIGMEIRNTKTSSIQSSPLKFFMEDLVKEHNQTVKFWLDNWNSSWNGRDVWIILDAFLKTEMEDYLKNIEYVNKDFYISNPFSSNKVEEEKALLWIRVNYEVEEVETDNFKYVEIQFVNLIYELDSLTIKRQLQRRFPKQANFLLNNLNCRQKITTSPINNYKNIDTNVYEKCEMLSVSLLIPYII